MKFDTELELKRMKQKCVLNIPNMSEGRAFEVESENLQINIIHAGGDCARNCIANFYNSACRREDFKKSRRSVSFQFRCARQRTIIVKRLFASV